MRRELVGLCRHSKSPRLTALNLLYRLNKPSSVLKTPETRETQVNEGEEESSTTALTSPPSRSLRQPLERVLCTAFKHCKRPITRTLLV